MITDVTEDYRRAAVDPPTSALLDFAVRLTRAPWSDRRAEIERLRRHGFDDEAIHDAVQVVALFNYYNRVCDALGVDLEEFMPPQQPSWTRHHP